MPSMAGRLPVEWGHELVQLDADHKTWYDPGFIAVGWLALGVSHPDRRPATCLVSDVVVIPQRLSVGTHCKGGSFC